MTLPNSSVEVTPGNGAATIATHTVSSKHNEVVMAAPYHGEIRGTQPVFFLRSNTAVNGIAQGLLYWSFWNGHASASMRILSIKHLLEMLNTGGDRTSPANIVIARTTTIHNTTDSIAMDSWAADTTHTLPSGVEARFSDLGLGVGGVTLGTDLFRYAVSGHTLSGSSFYGCAFGGIECLPPAMLPAYGGRGILVPAGSGLCARTVDATDVGSEYAGFVIAFSQEP